MCLVKAFRATTDGVAVGTADRDDDRGSLANQGAAR
jgi:hypothetical protein